MLKQKIFFIIFLFIMLYSCQDIDRGIVIERKYEPKRTYVIYQNIIVGKSFITVPYFATDDEDYILTVKGVTEKGDTIVKDFYVDSNHYLNVGSFFCVDGNCSETDNNNTKVRQ